MPTAVKTGDACVSILEGALFTKKEADAFRKRMDQWTPAEKAAKQDWINQEIQAHIADGIDAKVKQVQDMVNVKNLVQQMTTDPFSGKTLTAVGDVMKNRLDMLVGRNSVDTRRRALKSHLKGQIDEFERIFDTQSNQRFKSLRDIKKGSAEEKELYKRVHDYTEKLDPDTLTPGKVAQLTKGADDIQKLALSLVAYNEYSRKTLAKYGMSVKFNKNYVMKRRYDWDAVKTMNPKEFGEFMADQLDLEATFGKGTTREQAIEYLGTGKDSFYSDIATDAAEYQSPTANREITSDRANSKSRKFTYKNSDAAYNAFNKLSLGGMREQFERNASSMATSAISVSEFGYNPKQVLAEVERELASMYKGQKKGVVDSWLGERIRQAEADLTGTQSITSGAPTNFANAVRFMMAFSKLGNAVTGTILDVVDNNRQVFYVNGNMFGGFGEFGVAMTKATVGMNQSERMAMAQQLGISLNHFSVAESMRLADGSVGHNGGRLTQWISEHGDTAMNIATMLPAQTSRSKVASGMVGAQTFAKLMDKYASGTKLNKFELDTLLEYGFNENELKTLTSGMIERSNNWVSTPIYSSQGIRNSLLNGVDEKHIGKVASMLGVKPEQAGRAVLELATKYDSFLNDFVVRGTPTPELATKTAMFKGTNSELIRTGIALGTQFMDTPIAQLGHAAELHRKLSRINDTKLGYLKDAVPHLATYLAVALPAYFAADYAMSIVTNRESLVDKMRNGDGDTRKKVWMQALGRSGVVPFLFEVADSQWGGGYNKTALDTFGSPAMSTLEDTLRLAKSNDSGGLSMKDYLLRQGPTNSIPLRALNNWSDFAIGNKLWETRDVTRFSR
jgi:hypothetical protein